MWSCTNVHTCMLMCDVYVSVNGEIVVIGCKYIVNETQFLTRQKLHNYINKEC